MTESQAKILIQSYIDGWKADDVGLICQPLGENCKIIESHGPIYNGVEEVKEWVEAWVKGEYRVDKWDIISFLFDDDTAVFEWSFAFSSPALPSQSIDGISIAKFKSGKIVHLREYRSTEMPYVWSKNKLLNPH